MAVPADDVELPRRPELEGGASGAFVKLDGDPERFIRNCYSQYQYLTVDSIANEMRLVCNMLDVSILED